jgi:hypothetical protein
MLSIETIRSFRAKTFRQAPGLRVKSKGEALQFVDERGFIYFWPITDVVLPSLWTAVAGDRPVADEHDDPGHISWGWKDEMLGKHLWYYGKVLRKRATIISLEAAPYFYALSENYGSPEEDYLTLYKQGRLTIESKLVFETLLHAGPLDTLALRRSTHLASRESDSRFNKALVDLQAGFQILPVGISQAGRWHYAFIYEVVHRHFPELLEQARSISERQARQKLAELTLRSVGVAQEHDLIKLFGWSAAETGRAVDDLVKAGLAQESVQVEKQPGNWICWIELAAGPERNWPPQF